MQEQEWEIRPPACGPSSHCSSGSLNFAGKRNSVVLKNFVAEKNCATAALSLSSQLGEPLQSWTGTAGAFF